MNDEKTQPIDRTKLYPVSAAIWKNVGQDGRPYYSFTLERSYKKPDGGYDSTASFGLGEALLVAKLCNLVDNRIRKLRDADRQEAAAEASYDEDVTA